MTEISKTQNLNSHYSTKTKAERPERSVAIPPNSIPSYHLYNDIDANKKMRAINDDIYEDAQKEKKQFNKKFLKCFLGVVGAIIAFIGLKRIFK